MWSIIILFRLLLPFTSLRNHAAHNWVVWIQLSNLEQSALIWHQAIGYSVGKIDVFWKTFDKVRGKIVKIMRSWNTSHILVQKWQAIYCADIQLAIIHTSVLQALVTDQIFKKRKKKITPDCGLLVLGCSSFSNILIILTILLLTLCHYCPAQESLALKG